MGDMAAVCEKKVLDHVNGKTTYTFVTDGCFIGLCTNATPGDPTMATPGTFTELTLATFGYARQQITGANWAVATQATTAPSSAASAATITFGPCSGTNWGTCYGFGQFETSAGAAATFMRYWGTLSSSVTINVGDQLQITSGNYTLTLN